MATSAKETNSSEGDFHGVDEQQKEFICCRSCSHWFNDTTRLPKFLNCHHFFCLQCLVLIEHPPRVECPECRGSTDLGAGSVANLATNHMSLWMVQKARQEFQVKRETQSRKKLFCLSCVCESQQCSTVGTHVLAQLSEGIDILYNKIESKLQDFETDCEKALVDIKSCQSVYSSVKDAIFRIRSKLQDFEDHFEKLRASVTAKEREAGLSKTRDLTDETSNAIDCLFERLCNLKETKEEVAQITTEAQTNLQKIEAINQTKMTLSLNCNRHRIGTLRFPPECRELPLSFNSEQNIPEFVRDFVPLFSYFVLKCATFVPSGSTAAATNDQQVDPLVTGGGASRPSADDAELESSPTNSTSATKSGESGATSNHENPTNTKNTLVYDRSFLLELRNAPLSQRMPDKSLTDLRDLCASDLQLPVPQPTAPERFRKPTRAVPTRPMPAQQATEVQYRPFVQTPSPSTLYRAQGNLPQAQFPLPTGAAPQQQFIPPAVGPALLNTYTMQPTQVYYPPQQQPQAGVVPALTSRNAEAQGKKRRPAIPIIDPETQQEVGFNAPPSAGGAAAAPVFLSKSFDVSSFYKGSSGEFSQD